MTVINSDSKRFQDQVVVITGAGSGIGAALAEAFDSQGAIVALCDINAKLANQLASNRLTHPQRPRECFPVDVTDAKKVGNMIRQIFKIYGKIDVYCSNAGIVHNWIQQTMVGVSGVTRHSGEQWNRLFQVNTLSHVIAAQELLSIWGQHKQNIKPNFVITASAAGILTQIGDASYGVSKAGAVSFAEHLAIEHGDSIHVLCICPQAVDTPFGNGMVRKTSNVASTDGIISPQRVATCTLEAIAAQSSAENDSSMFIFPHPEVETYMKRKGEDHVRWLRGMRRFKNSQQRDSSRSSPSSIQSKL